MWHAWTNAGVGMWLMITAFVHMDQSNCITSNLVIGALTAIIGWRMKTEKRVQEWLSVLMGVWVMTTVFIPPLMQGKGFLWNNVVSGLLITITGLAALGGKVESEQVNTFMERQWDHHGNRR